MGKIERYILMFQNEEVLSFLYDRKKSNITFLDKLEHFDKAPYGLVEANEKDRDRILLRFFRNRTISVNRYDYQRIMDATSSKDGLDLVFKGYGLSLSNHYWFKKEDEQLNYEDINFFTNKWDDSFARAVLEGRYEDLKNCDINVPDVTIGGWASKGWLYEEDGPKLYKLGLYEGEYDDSLGEVLASRLAKRLFKEDEVVKYELKKIGDKYASVSSPMVKLDEEIIPLSHVVPGELYHLYFTKSTNKETDKIFYEKIKKIQIPGLFDRFVKLACLRSICFVADLHFDNISIIRNLKTGEIRVAPFYDLAGSFGTGKTAKQMIENVNKGSYFVIYFLFNNLDPNWDYSWYEPSKLEGFENEIKEVLSKSSFYLEERIDRIIEVYQKQKSFLDELKYQK